MKERKREREWVSEGKKERGRKNGNPILHYFLAPLASSFFPSIEVNRSSRTSESLWQLTVLIRCTCVSCLSFFSLLFHSFFSSFPFFLPKPSLTFVSRLLSFELSLHSVICILLCIDDPFFLLLIFGCVYFFLLLLFGCVYLYLLLLFGCVRVWKKGSVCACVCQRKEKRKRKKEIVLSEETEKDMRRKRWRAKRNSKQLFNDWMSQECLDGNNWKKMFQTCQDSSKGKWFTTSNEMKWIIITLLFHVTF